MPGDMHDLIKRIARYTYSTSEHDATAAIEELHSEVSDLEDRLESMTSACTSAAATAERACERLILYQAVVDAAKELRDEIMSCGGVYGDCHREVDAVSDAYDALERSLAARVSA